MKTALLFIALFAWSCSYVDQEVKFLDGQGYCLETTAWDGMELVSYQLVYTDEEYNLFHKGHVLTWFTTKQMTDSIKSAQYQFAENALEYHKTAMK